MSGPAAPARRFAIEYAIAEKIVHPAMSTCAKQQLTAFKRSQRISIYQAEKVAAPAISLVPADRILRAGITRRLLDVYVSRATARSLPVLGRSGPHFGSVRNCCASLTVWALWDL